MLMLGSLLVNGQGLPRNLELGLGWVRRAAGSGDPEVAWRAERAAEELSSLMEAASARTKAVIDDLRRQRDDSDPFGATVARAPPSAAQAAARAG